MRGFRILPLVALALLAGAPVAAQTVPPRTPLVRADAYGTLGWFNADADSSYDEWYNRSLHGGAGIGWYWTDHLRTELEFAGTTEAEMYGAEPLVVGGQSAYLNFRQRLSTKKVGVGQYYQFFRNAWFHPHVAAGVDLTWERVERTDEPVFFFDPVVRQGRSGRERLEHPPATSVVVRPVVSTGFKAYMTPRAFFRSDLRVGVRDGIDEVLLRFGFGVDF